MNKGILMISLGRLLMNIDLEEIFKNAVIARTILYSIAEQNDENYSAYKKQSEIAYRQLVKFAKGVWQDKKLKI